MHGRNGPRGEGHSVARRGRIRGEPDRVGHACCSTHSSVSHPSVVLDPTGEPRRDWDLRLLDVARVRAWERLLFVQCGDGWIVEEAWRRLLKGVACGLDTSPAHVARATQLRGVPGKLEFKTWDGARLPCPSQSFHRVLSTFALEGCRDPAGLLREMHRVLEPGGEVFLLERQQHADGVAHAVSTAFTAALQLAGFHETHELPHHGPADGDADAAGVIIRARRATPPALPGAVEPAA